MSQFKFSVGPWNVHEGRDAFGPEVRKTIPFAEKVKNFKELGFDAIQLHDDDAVPGLNDLTDAQMRSRARELKRVLNDNGLTVEFIGPRLWEDQRTIDGSYTSNVAAEREYALWRSRRAVDIARELGCNKVNIWPAREGTVCFESKNPVDGVNWLVEAVDQILAYDKEILVMIEPKPNEPIDRSFCPTFGHVMAVAYQTRDPKRVGGLLESAHAVLTGLDPANEIAFGLACGKLWSVHLNDQNGLKYDQDKTFGAENLRQAFNQVRLLVENKYGSHGEYIGFDVKAMRTQPLEQSYQHLKNSLQLFKLLEAKAHKFDYAFQRRCVSERNYEQLEMYVIELLMSGC